MCYLVLFRIKGLSQYWSACHKAATPPRLSVLQPPCAPPTSPLHFSDLPPHFCALFRRLMQGRRENSPREGHSCSPHTRKHAPSCSGVHVIFGPKLLRTQPSRLPG
ncbi:hypothetical protein KIL84_015524 [Mauremys mutica]|uniref:Uncharacterized protein n=1 Tax=Mauremys mutica TaxID=74926 RepID=A0A9D3WSG8_9SAUR|nr:hypothetical protein KIL84_015524 [Mauremys mutica]